MAEPSMRFTSLQEIPTGPLTMEGHDVCFRNAADLLEAMGLPGGLLPVENVIDCGFDKSTGIVWIRQKKKTQHFFRRIGRTVSLDTEIRAHISHRRLHSISGVRAKELLIWAPVGDVSVVGDDGNQLKFKSYGGISRTYPAQAFARANFFQMSDLGRIFSVLTLEYPNMYSFCWMMIH